MAFATDTLLWNWTFDWSCIARRRTCSTTNGGLVYFSYSLLVVESQEFIEKETRSPGRDGIPSATGRPVSDARAKQSTLILQPCIENLNT